MREHLGLLELNQLPPPSLLHLTINILLDALLVGLHEHVAFCLADFVLTLLFEIAHVGVDRWDCEMALADAFVELWT